MPRCFSMFSQSQIGASTGRGAPYAAASFAPFCASLCHFPPASTCLSKLRRLLVALPPPLCDQLFLHPPQFRLRHHQIEVPPCYGQRARQATLKIQSSIARGWPLIFLLFVRQLIELHLAGRCSYSVRVLQGPCRGF